MAHHIFVRQARQKEAQQFLDWSEKTGNNLFDPDVAAYPTTFVLVAFDHTGPLVYMPAQQPLFLDALAIRPGLEPRRVAMALKELTQAMVTQANIKGSGELYFLCKDEATCAFAESHGYKELPYRMFRMKLADLEKPEEETPNDAQA